MHLHGQCRSEGVQRRDGGVLVPERGRDAAGEGDSGRVQDDQQERRPLHQQAQLQR